MPAFKKVYTESYRSGFYHPISILILALITLTVALAIFANSGFFANKNVPAPNQSPQIDAAINWKTYKSKDNLYQLSYPGSWTVNEMDDVSMGDNAIDISIIEWNDGSKEYVEEQWQNTQCGGGGDGNSNIGCIPMEIKESKKINLSGNPAYWRLDGNGQMHAWIQNKGKNKTIEIYSVLLKDKNLFNQILSTFRFLN